MRRIGCCVLATLAACGPSVPTREQVVALFSDPARWARDSGSVGEAGAGAQLFLQLCNRCHDLGNHGQDGRLAPSEGAPARNTPTIIDSGSQALQGWDGRCDELRPMIAHELRTRAGIVDEATLRAAMPRGSGLLRQLEQPGPPLLAAVVGALQSHVLRLRSRGRWDRFVEGDDGALTTAERHGLDEFITAGCATCHAGRALGGASCHKLGLARPYPTADPGRAAVTGKDGDRFCFKAPALRLVVHTAPYLHDGSVADLGVAVRLMARHELGRELRDDQVDAMLTFLRAVGDVEPIRP